MREKVKKLKKYFWRYRVIETWGTVPLKMNEVFISLQDQDNEFVQLFQDHTGWTCGGARLVRVKRER